MKHLLLSLIALFSGITSLFSQRTNDKVNWSFEAQKVSTGEYDIIFTATVAPSWCIYSQYLSSDDGPVRTSFNFDNNAAVEPIGKIEEKGAKKQIFDKMFNMNVTKLFGKIQFVQRVKVKNTTALKGAVTFMSCDENSCLPPSDVDFNIALNE
jgi:Disulphide bond corrector protein DsbC